jgi:hypothetical protein
MDALKVAMGGCCARCEGMLSLEMDCIRPQGDAHHKLSMDMRATFYRRQHAAGNLQLLCQWCHAEKSATEHPRRRAAAAVPDPDLVPF